MRNLSRQRTLVGICGVHPIATTRSGIRPGTFSAGSHPFPLVSMYQVFAFLPEHRGRVFGGAGRRREEGGGPGFLQGRHPRFSDHGFVICSGHPLAARA